MTYQFNLEWDELSEELREQKVDEYLRALGDEAEDLVGDPRYYAEEVIRAHFPIYF